MSKLSGSRRSVLLLSLLMAGCGLAQPVDARPPQAVQGVLDLSEWRWAENGPIRLDGEWEFYWKKLLEPGDFAGADPPVKTGFIRVPSIWNGYEVAGAKLSGDGYATFRLAIELEDPHSLHALRIMVMATAYRLWVDGDLVASNGQVGTSSETSIPQSLPQIASFSPRDSTLHVVLQVSNFSHRKGGIWDAIELGSGSQIHRRRSYKQAFESLLLGSLLIMALYHFGLFGLRRKDRSTFYFGALCLLIACRILVTGECFLIGLFPNLGWEIAFKIEYLSFYLAVPTFIAFIQSTFPDDFSKRIQQTSWVLGVVFGLIVLCTPALVYSHTLVAYEVATLMVGAYTIYVLISCLLKRREGAALFVGGTLVFFVTVINDMLFAHPVVYTGYLAPFGIFVFIIAQSLVSSMRFSRAFNTVEMQGVELQETNTALREEVATRVRVEEDLRQSEEELRRHRDQLEEEVAARTVSLQAINEQLQQEIVERIRGEEGRAKLEARILQAEKMEAMGNLAGGVAHDLNNILSGVVSLPELILMDLPNDSPLRDPIQTVKDSGERAAAVVNDLLTLARRGVSVSEVVNMNHIISDLLKSPEYLATTRLHPRVSLLTDPDPSLLNVLGSPVHLSKAVMNLVSNAAESMAEGGTLTLSTENRYLDRPIGGYDGVEEGDYVVISVADTGAGISPADMERIFEPFHTKKHMGRSGSGLGMTVVWGTVSDHHGYIDVKSAVGAGTTFTLYFPATRQEASATQIALTIEEYMGQGESVLVVDDVAEQQRIASVMLAKLGYSVATVSSGEEAVQYLEEGSADLLVLDMIMDPGMDGLDTYRKVVARNPEQKAIIVSGFAETDRAEETQRLGAGAYVRKPYLIEELGVAVKTALSSASH